MFRVTYTLFNDEVWLGDFPTYDMALDYIEKEGKLLYYENGVNNLVFTVWYDHHLYQEVVYSV